MICSDRKLNQEHKGCVNFNGKGYCKREDRMRCLEWMKNGNITLSQSSIKAWNCRKKFEFSQLFGVESIKDKPSIMMGNLVDNYISKKKTFEIVDEYRAKAAALCKFIGKTFDWSDFDTQVRGSYFIKRPGLNISMFGYLDLAYKETRELIIDVKTTSKPHDYVNHFNVREQSCAYLSMFPEAKKIAYFLCRPSQLKYNSNKESPIDFACRIYEDILDRPDFYFYKSMDGIGITYDREDFDLKEYENEVINVAQELKFALNNHEEFTRNEDACRSPYVCDYIGLCEAGLDAKNLPAQSYRYRSMKNWNK